MAIRATTASGTLEHARASLADTSGSTAIMAAICFGVVACFMALAINASSLYFLRRKQQSATDLAAMAAASLMASASQSAAGTLSLNGIDASALQLVEPGVYVADSSVPVAQRFTPTTSGIQNAVRITVVTHPATMFDALFSTAAAIGTSPPPSSAHPAAASPPAGYAITTLAVAAQNARASFAIGSRLAQLNGGVLNATLGGLVGGNLSLSVMDYQSLASAQIDLFSFANALAVRANVTAVTYDQLAQGSFRVGDVLGAISDVGASNPLISSALSQIAAAPNSPTTTIPLSPIISFGPYSRLLVGSPAPMPITVSALDLLSATAQVANGAHQIQLALNANIPGIASVSLQLAIGERPVGESFAAIGTQGASVHTAQTRLLLNIQLVATGQTSLVNLPVYIELASGTAVLSSIQCSPSNLANSSVTLAVTPSVIDAWIGNVSNADFTNFSTAPDPGAATLLNVVNLATVSGRAHATITNLSATPVTFNYADILAATKQTTSTTDFISSLLGNLFGNLQLNVNVIGLGLGLPSGLSQTVGNTLSTATSPIDQLLTSLLDTLGVGLGQADTWVSGVKCGGAVLVN